MGIKIIKLSAAEHCREKEDTEARGPTHDGDSEQPTSHLNKNNEEKII